jgi:hypothetical protein
MPLRFDFDIDALAKELGQSQEEVLTDLERIAAHIRESQPEFVRNARDRGRSKLQLDLLCLAWAHCTKSQEG